MPRLLILCEYPTLLGGERSMLATMPAVAAAGFDVHIAAPPAGPLSDQLLSRGISHIPWPTHDDDGRRFSLADLRGSLADVIQSVQPDLVHANSLSSARIAGPTAIECNVRSVGYLRDIIKLNGQAISDLNCLDCIIAVSHATRDFHVAQGLTAEICVVIKNGVDLTEFRPRTPTGYLHRELKLPASTRFVAVVGQLGLRKATDVALAAAREVGHEFPALHWLIVGERTSHKDESREFEANLRAMAAKKPLAGHVHFLGSRTDVTQLLPECDLLVHPARQEPLGRVLLEAAASGLAIIATNVGGTPEIFPRDSAAAILVPPVDSRAIAGAVSELLNNDTQRKRLGVAARHRAESAFDIHIATSRLIEQYHLVLAQSRS
jgi:glycosyltransferase involved in cell wall biosynthesis